MTIIPAYVILSKLQWIDTYWALIIPHMSSVFAIFLIAQKQFVRSATRSGLTGM